MGWLAACSASVHMRPFYRIALFAVLPLMAQPQRFTFGVTGGISGQTPLGQTDSRTPFALGFTTDVRISSRLSFETGVLAHRMGQQLTHGVFLYPENAVTLTSGTQRANAFEVPFLAKYHLRGENNTWRPFLTAGPTVRRTSLQDTSSATILSGTNLVPLGAPPILSRTTVNWNLDPALGAGVDFRAGRFHLEPQARYSYWGAGKNTSVRKNQVDFLLGFRF